MATRKTASKSSSKVNANFNINKPSKRTSKNISKQLKKVSPMAIFLAVVLLVAGAVGGYFAINAISKNDCFEIVGRDEITLTLEQSYVDEGVKVIAFGKDETNKVVIDTNLKQKPDGSYYAEEIGTYYITYNVDSLKYGSIFKVQKVRLINFVEPSETEETETAQEEVVNE